MEITEDMIKWLLIIVILSMLGLNIFNYFYQVSDAAVKIASSGVKTGLDSASQTLKMSGKGVKQLGKVSGNIIGEIGNALDIHVIDKNNNTNLQGDNSDSSIQMPKKTGFCYIGEDRGVRQCIYVGNRDVCMSGNIFPSSEICVNPNLRA